MSKVYIEFTKPKERSFFSSLIMLFEKTEYSHVRFKWMDTKCGIWMVYEASGASVRFLGPQAQLQNEVHIIKSFELTLNKKQEGIFRNERMNMAGIQYGFKQIVGIGYSYITGKKSNIFADQEKTQVCSELAARILASIFNLDIPFDFDIAGPKAIDKYLTILDNNGHKSIKEIKVAA